MIILDWWEKGYTGVYLTRMYRDDTYGEPWYGPNVNLESWFYTPEY